MDVSYKEALELMADHVIVNAELLQQDPAFTKETTHCKHTGTTTGLESLAYAQCMRAALDISQVVNDRLKRKVDTSVQFYYTVVQR